MSRLHDVQCCKRLELLGPYLYGTTCTHKSQMRPTLTTEPVGTMQVSHARDSMVVHTSKVVLKHASDRCKLSYLLVQQLLLLHVVGVMVTKQKAAGKHKGSWLDAVRQQPERSVVFR